jgi:vacuolar protein sorting-associated protein 35
MEVVIQVFPDEFHLQTLEIFLQKCAQLQEGVNVKNIVIMMMTRLANYAKESPEQIPTGLEMFPLFHKHTSNIIESKEKMPLGDTLALQVALVNFASKCYPDRIEYIDNVLSFSAQTLEKAKANNGGNLDSKCVKQVVELLSLPLEALSLKILELKSYAPLMMNLEESQKKTVATTIVKSVFKSKSHLDSAEKVEILFTLVSSLILGGDEVPDDERFEFDQEQHLMAQLFHLISNEDTDVHYKLYATARKHFLQGGPQRIEYTLPPLVLGSLQLVQRVQIREAAGEDMQVKTKKVFGFIHKTISELSSRYPNLSLRLYLQAALMANTCGFQAIAYEFTTQSFICYENEISDSKLQFLSINYIVATIQNLSVFSQEEYNILVNKCYQHSAKLLKKTDQCRAVCNCAHLFWPGDDAQPGHRDEKRVLACLQRALKIANACMGHQVHLFVEILNKYLYFFDRGCPSISVKYLRGLLALIDEHVPNQDQSETSKVAKAHYENTRKHIKLKAMVENDIGQRYQEIGLE